MSTTIQEHCVQVERIADVLTQLGDALARPDLGAMTACEPLIEELTRALATAVATPADRDRLLPLLTEARLALRRAEHLGEGLVAFAAATFAAHGRAHAYDREGRTTAPGLAGVLDARG